MRYDEDGFPIWEDTPLRKLAREENWGIFMLMGMRRIATSYLHSYISPGNYNHLIDAIDEAILNIKATQQNRKLK